MNWNLKPDPATWPEGTCTIRVPSWTVQKILSKHVVSGPQWQQIVEDQLAQSLQEIVAEGGTVDFDNHDLRHFLNILEHQASASLTRPLVLVYEINRRGTSPKSRWLLVLPCGAQMVLGRQSGDYVLITCFFPNLRVRTNARRPRWQHLVKKLVALYGRFARQGLVPSDANTRKAIFGPDGEVKEYRSNIQFVTHDSWGFRTDLDGHPWRTTFDPWTTPSVASDRAKPPAPRILKPRYQSQD